MSNIAPLIHVVENNISSIQCNVTSYPAPTISWFYAADKVNFVDVSSQAVTQSVASTTYESKLISQLNFLSGVKRTDKGAYYCQAVNTEGNTRKDTELAIDCKYLKGPQKIENTFYRKVKAHLQ